MKTGETIKGFFKTYLIKAKEYDYKGILIYILEDEEKRIIRLNENELKLI